MPRCALGVDVGGTFTDLVLVEQDSGRQHCGKVPSTPQQPDEAVATGVVPLCQQSGLPPAALAFFIHGTTVATNALASRRPVYLDGAWQSVPVYDRARLAPGHAFAGPAIVEQFDSTTLVAPGQRARVDGFGSVRIEVSTGP